MRILTSAGALMAALSASDATAAPAPPTPAPYLAEVRAFAFNFCPQGWSPADGRLFPIGPNQALFSLLGTTYGGDGQTNFALPDLGGRTPLGTGHGVNLGTVFSASAQGAPPQRFLGMTWCIAIQGAYPGRAGFRAPPPPH